MRSDVSESLNRYLSKIITWCYLWGMRLNPNKTSITANRSRTIVPPHPDLFVGSTSLNLCDSEILVVMFDSDFTFERHIHSISSSVAQRIGLLSRKSFRVFGNQDVLLRCFILSCLEYCFPVWFSAAVFMSINSLPIWTAQSKKMS